MNKKQILSAFFIIIFAFASIAQNNDYQEVSFPEHIGNVSDHEKIFSEKQIVELNSIITIHEKETTNEIAIVTIDSLPGGKDIFNYSKELANQWGIGKKDKDNGIVIVFGKKIRKISINIGYGLETKLTNDEAQAIINNTIIPEFKNGDFYSGIKKGLLKVIDEIK